MTAGLTSVPGHAFGARYDLPVPLSLFVLGGAVVVFVSFLVVLPTRVAAASGTPEADRARLRTDGIAAGGAAWLIVALLVACGLAGSQVVSENLLPTAFWLLAWVAAPVTCGVLGDWTRAVNPFAALARAVDRDGLRRALIGGPALPWPSRLAWWPATALFVAVASGELVFNATATVPRATALAILSYAVVTTAGSILFGAGPWLERGEMFSVLYATWGRLGWFRFGAPGRRGFLGGLDAPFEPVASRVTFVLLLLVSVSFDGLLATPAWRDARTRLPGGLAPGTLGYELAEVAAFLVLALAAWGLFGGFAVLVTRAGRLAMSRVQAVAGLLPSLLPIAFGYLLAHNLEYLVINGQLLLPLLGNPAGLDGWHRFGYPFNDDYVVNTDLLPSSVVWYLQVALIIAVHIAAVILAHRHLARTAGDERRARRAEWPWIVAMVGYTMTSLWLLAQPLVKEG